MEHGQITLEREQPGRLLSWGIRFFLSAALTASQTPSAHAPFALGFLAASGPGADGVAALAGAAAGAFLFLDFAHALPFLAVAILIVTANSALRGTWFLARPRTAALTAVALFLMVETLYVLQSLSPAEQLRGCAAAAGLLGAAAWLFRPLLRPKEAQLTPDSLVYLAAAILLAVSDLTILDLSPGHALLCLLLAWTVFDRTPAQGAAIGLGLGLTADLCGSGKGLLTAAFGLAGLVCGTRRYRWSVALAFLAAVLAAALPSGNVLPLLVEAAMGMAVFLLMPSRFFGGKRVRPPDPAERETGLRWKEQLTRAAGALRDLYDSMGRSAPPSTDENPAIIFDRSAEKVCRDCALCDLCWQKDYSSTFNALNDATPFLLERGRAMPKDFPAHFANRCIHLPELLTAVNGELSAFLLRRQYRRQLEETRKSARGQYAQLSELLTATAAGLGTAVPVSGGADACQVGVVLRPKEGESVCGDTVTSFQTDQGRWCLLLADGMGSGEPARKESALTCRLLRQFLEAGIAPEAALKTLNSAMALRGTETGSFTTIDLCVFDPEAGEAAFYKFGAAPSYLKKNGSVRRITGKSLPAGLRGAPASPDITRAPLEPGSFAVMISDGVADPVQDEWLLDLLAGWDGNDPQELASVIMAESVRREHLRDDCGIQVLHRPEAQERLI